MDRMDVSSWLHSKGQGRYAEGVCDALGAHGLPSSTWRHTLEAMPSSYFEDFIQALAEAEAAQPEEGSVAGDCEVVPALLQPALAPALLETGRDVPSEVVQSDDPAYDELLRECSRALSPGPELSRQSSDVIAELERMVSTPLSPAAAPADPGMPPPVPDPEPAPEQAPAVATHVNAGPFSPQRLADPGSSDLATGGASACATAATVVQVAEPEVAAAPAAAETPPVATSSAHDLRIENTVRMMPSTPSERPKRSQIAAVATGQARSGALDPAVCDPGMPPVPQAHLGAGDEDPSYFEADDPTPVLTQLRAKAAAAAAAAAAAPPSPAPLSSVLVEETPGMRTEAPRATTSASSSGTGSFGRARSSSDSDTSGDHSRATGPDAVAPGRADDQVDSGVTSQQGGEAVGGVNLSSLVDHFRTDEVPAWLLKELEQALLDTGPSTQDGPAPGASASYRGDGHRSLAAAATIEEQRKIEQLLAAPLLPPPDRELLSPGSSPTPSPDKPNSPDHEAAPSGTVVHDVTRPTYSWAQQHPIAMAAKTTRASRGKPRRVSVRRMPHPRTPDASREASHDPGAWLMQASYAIHGRWLVVDTFYEWKLWMRRLAQQRARTGGLHGLSPAPPGVSWRLRRERYQMLQAAAEGAAAGSATQSRQLSPESRAKLAAEAAAAANEHLVWARQRRERRRQQIRMDTTNAHANDGGNYDFGGHLPAGYLRPQQLHPAAAALGLSVGNCFSDSRAALSERSNRSLEHDDGIRAGTHAIRAALEVPDAMLMNDRQHRTQLSYGDYVRPPSARPSSLRDRERSDLTAKFAPGSAGSIRAAGQRDWEVVDRNHGQHSQNALSTDVTQLRQSEPLSWAVAELESGLVALQKMLKPHAELLLQEFDAESERSRADTRKQAPRLMQAAIASAEAFADSVVEAAAVTGTMASHPERGSKMTHAYRHQHKETEAEINDRKMDLDCTIDGEELPVKVDPNALIELGPPATGGYNARSTQQRHSRNHSDVYGRSTPHSASHQGSYYGCASPDRVHGMVASQSHGTVRGYDARYGSNRRIGTGNTPPSHGRSRSRSRSPSRSLSPPASPIYVVKREYEVVDPPAFLDLAPKPRERPRDHASGRYEYGHGAESAERACVQASGKRRRRP